MLAIETTKFETTPIKNDSVFKSKFYSMNFLTIP